MIKIVAGRDRYREPLLLSTNRPVAEGEQVHCDGGCAVDGYRCDFMRSAVIGNLSDAAERRYSVAVEALEVGLQNFQPGQPLSEAWRAADGVLTKDASETGPALTWGHGIGLDHWEPPQIARPGTAEGDILARPGMVLCFEPSAGPETGYVDPAEGVFIVEDQLVITESGIDNLTTGMPHGLFRA